MSVMVIKIAVRIISSSTKIKTAENISIIEIRKATCNIFENLFLENALKKITNIYTISDALITEASISIMFKQTFP